MHDLSSSENQIQRDLHESDELLGKECSSCMRAFTYNQFRVDTSMKDGRVHQCQSCEASPRLSTAEHVDRLRKLNNNSEAVKSQRWEDQEYFKDYPSRVGKPMHHVEFFDKLKKITGDKIYYEQGNFESDLAIYQMYGTPQPQLDGRQFEYLFYATKGTMPEYDLVEFDEVRDVPKKPLMRGWRTLLLSLIRRGTITEDEAHRVFGKSVGNGGYIYRRDLYRWRNRRSSASAELARK